jgi:DNA polymerase-3 subunit gamma/tau
MEMEYRVLARKYRPTSFDDLIGQEVLVRTLSNAIAQGRVAHAFLLTGIRGIGKTTTARIIARALNCEQGPTINPCGVCSQCVGIAEDRNVDVIEMDAASRTGVDAMRDLIESVRYMPNAARYKIYIIDEVHMLSTSAFNALLKTLEEPPPHVKFIFATTELHKIPVTILSRCQRFDLKRITTEMLAGHLKNICGKESVAAEDAALTLIATAAEGSVRDALSLLDQAIARSNNITLADVRDMLGAADNTATFALLESLLSGQVSDALAQLRVMYSGGSDPLMITQEAMELTHLITRIKINPEAANDVTLSENDRTKALEFAAKLSMPVLARLWQMLLKGLSEIKGAPSGISALEMLLIRIAYAADVPTPAELIRSTPAETSASPQQSVPAATVKQAPVLVAAAKVAVNNYKELVDLFSEKREALLHIVLHEQASLVSFEPGKIALNISPPPARDFITKVTDNLKKWTGDDWQLLLSSDAGEPTLKAQELAYTEKLKEEAASQPLVASVLDQFPGAKIVGVKG